VDAIFGLLLLFQGISGLVLWLVLPGGYGFRGGFSSGGGASSFLFTRNSWIDIHTWMSVALLVVFALHTFIHWRWLAETTRSYSKHNGT